MGTVEVLFAGRVLVKQVGWEMFITSTCCDERLLFTLPGAAFCPGCFEDIPFSVPTWCSASYRISSSDVGRRQCQPWVKAWLGEDVEVTVGCD